MYLETVSRDKSGFVGHMVIKVTTENWNWSNIKLTVFLIIYGLLSMIKNSHRITIGTLFNQWIDCYVKPGYVKLRFTGITDFRFFGPEEGLKMSNLENKLRIRSKNLSTIGKSLGPRTKFLKYLHFMIVTFDIHSNSKFEFLPHIKYLINSKY